MDNKTELINVNQDYNDQNSNSTSGKVLSTVTEFLPPANDTLEIFDSIFSKFQDTKVAIHEIDADIHKLDLKFNAYIADLEHKMAKYEISSEIVKESIEAQNKRIDKILEQTLAIDIDNENKINLKLKMLEMLNAQTDKLASMLIQLL